MHAGTKHESPKPRHEQQPRKTAKKHLRLASVRLYICSNWANTVDCLGESLPGLDSAAAGYLIGLLLAGGCSSWPLTDQSRGLLTES